MATAGAAAAEEWGSAGAAGMGLGGGAGDGGGGDGMAARSVQRSARGWPGARIVTPLLCVRHSAEGQCWVEMRC